MKQCAVNLLFWGCICKNSPKQINHFSTSLYAVYVLKNSFNNLGHLGESYHQPLGLPAYKAIYLFYNHIILRSWPEVGSICVWEFENLDRGKPFLIMLLYWVKDYGS